MCDKYFTYYFFFLQNVIFMYYQIKKSSPSDKNYLRAKCDKEFYKSQFDTSNMDFKYLKIKRNYLISFTDYFDRLFKTIQYLSMILIPPG